MVYDIVSEMDHGEYEELQFIADMKFRQWVCANYPVMDGGGDRFTLEGSMLELLRGTPFMATATDERGRTPMHYAVFWHLPTAIRVLREHGRPGVSGIDAFRF